VCAADTDEYDPARLIVPLYNPELQTSLQNTILASYGVAKIGTNSSTATNSASALGCNSSLVGEAVPVGSIQYGEQATMNAPNSTFWLCEHNRHPVLAEDNRHGVMTSCAVSNEFSGTEDLCATDLANHVSEPSAKSTGVADSSATNESSSSSPGNRKHNSRKEKR